MFSFNSYAPTVDLILVSEASLEQATAVLKTAVVDFQSIYPEEALHYLSNLMTGEENSELEHRLLQLNKIDIKNKEEVSRLYTHLDLLRHIFGCSDAAKYVKRQLDAETASKWRKSLEHKLYGEKPTEAQLAELYKNLDAVRAVFN